MCENDQNLEFIVKKTVRTMINERWGMIPAIIPQSISDDIKENVKSSMRTRFNLNYGHQFLGIETTLVPDGTIDIELTDMTNWSIWRGILRPPTHGS